jgi:phage recombination protein Bet
LECGNKNSLIMETQIVKQELSFNNEQVALIKSQIAPKATDSELKLFLYQAQRTGLDPLTRQIYCIHRKQKQGDNWIEKMTVQTAIDGFRVIAERSGDYGGQDEPEFIEKDGKIICCKVKVYKFRGDQRYQASVGVAYWDEYVPQSGQDHMWRKMPHTMISKVAEALALRKAYPQDLSGLYTTEEMQQADVKQEPAQESQVSQSENLEELHAEFMGWLNQLIGILGDDALKYHPDNWKKERSPANYRKAISELKVRVSHYAIV